jgi:hypothetical protein
MHFILSVVVPLARPGGALRRRDCIYCQGMIAETRCTALRLAVSLRFGHKLVEATAAAASESDNHWHDRHRLGLGLGPGADPATPASRSR